ncbi:IgGFc-binding protein-like [Lampetra planeri]
MESWKVDNCTIATCNGGNNISYSTKKCSVSKKPKCRNAVMVYDADGCCYTWKCFCNCKGWGDPHIRTFDQVLYAFLEDCTYTLVEEKVDRHHLSIITDNFQFFPGTPASFPRGITVNYNGNSVNMSIPAIVRKKQSIITVLYNNELVKLPFSSDGIEITSTDVIVTVHIPAIYSTIVFTGQMYSIDLPYELFGDNTQGQCGTCNNQASDDCVRKSGKSEASDCCQVTAKEWMVADPSKPHCKAPGPSGSVPCQTPTPTPTAPCVFDHKLCKAIDKTEFSACSEVTSLLSYIETCKFDQCRVNSTPAGCPSIQSAADDCAMLGYYVDWRKATEGGCDFECPVGMEYKPAGPKPVASCSSGGSVEMTTELHEGCFCPEGTMICDHACVPLPTSTISPSTTQERTTIFTFTTEKPSTTEGTTAFISSATSLGSLPTTPETTAVSTTVDKSCRSVNPPRQFMESWKVDNCTIATCNGGDNISYSTKKCSVSTKPKCRNAMMVYDADGCCYTWKCFCNCKGWGDPHIRTFDQVLYVFLEDCTYTLVEEKVDRHHLSIITDNFQFYPGNPASFPRGITVNYNGNSINMSIPAIVSKRQSIITVLYNNELVTLPFSSDGIEITSTDVIVTVQIPAIYSTIVFTGQMYSIDLPYELFGDNTQGQCGTCNNQGSDDCVRKSGKSEASDCCPVTAKEWMVADPSKPHCKSPGPSGSVPCETSTPTTTAPCVFDHKLCKAIDKTEFSACSEVTSLLSYIETCKFDQCRVNSTPAGCPSIQSAADDCAMLGYHVDWRKATEGGCDFECPVGMEYKPAGPKPVASCSSGGSVEMTTELREGCFCPEGTMICDHACVPLSTSTIPPSTTQESTTTVTFTTGKPSTTEVPTPAVTTTVHKPVTTVVLTTTTLSSAGSTPGQSTAPQSLTTAPYVEQTTTTPQSGGTPVQTTISEPHQSTSSGETSTAPLSTTAFISSATSLGSLPTIPETTAVSTTVDKGCRSVNPPRQFMESWKLDNCTIATCNGGDNISYSTKKCSVSKKPKCRNAMMVYDADGCCYTWKCFCNCKGWGDPHIRTFDQVLYAFLEDCTYTLVEEKVNRHHLSIITDNFQFFPGTPASFPRGITVNYNGNSVNMSIPAIVRKKQSIITVLYNNELVKLPFSSDGIEITSTDVIVTVHIPAIYSTIVFTGQMYSIDLPYELFGDNTQGQCGTCNNQASDDCVRKSGKSEASDCCQVTAKEWMVADPSKPHCKAPGPSGSVPCQTPTPTPTAPCVFDHKLCKAIDKTEFSACSEVTSLLSYIETCKFDQCRVNSTPAGCPSIQSAAGDCAMLGYYVDWRKATEGGCDFECPAGMEYKPAGPKPVASCSSGGSVEMTTELREGCFCPEGTMICDHACVPLPTSTIPPSTTQERTTTVTFTTEKPSTTEVTTAFISSATSLGSLPTTPETTAVSTTVDKGCRSVNPPRQFMESWKVDNCTIATCNGGDNISYSTKKCSVSKKPKCRNAMMVYDADGCCYTWKCFCNCKGWGDPHIRTFDQVLYAFLEDCTYTLVEEKVNRHHLSIITDNFQFFPGTPASFPRGITVNYNGNSVNMSIPAIVRKKQSIITVLYNNELVKLPFSSDGIEITSTDVIVTVHIPAIYSTIVFTGQMYSIDLPYELFGDNTQGQCGTCNNQASDDCVRKSGKSEASDCCQVTAKEWMVADPSKPHCKAPGPSGSVPCQTPTPTPTAPCVFDHKLCKAIDKTEFSACSEVTSLLSYIETCKFDQCRVNSTPAGCPSIQSAADDCAMLGYYVDWRKATEGGCDFECPVGMEYKPAGPKPVASCSSGGSVEMTTELREGCVCPEGTMICDHACVPLPTSTIPPSTTQERTTTVTFTTEKPSTTEVTTAFISSATSLGSLPTIPETTAVSTTVDKGCRSVNPPRQFMESWKVDNCTIATCNGGDNISYSTKKCSVSKKPKCRNAMMVYDADGCCYTWKCFCNCKGWGDPHIRTFDQVLYAFLEDCTYTLVEEKVNRHHLSIITDNFQFFPGTPASFPRGITVNYNGNSVNMSIPAIVRKKQSIITVLYNNELVKLPFSSDGIEITSTDVIVTVHIPAIYSTIVFTGQMYSIDLPYELFGDNTQGQCGTCNNQASDDCVRKSGKSEASDCCQVTAKEWMVADPSKPHCKAPGPSGSVPCQTPTPTPTAPCVFDHKLCKAIDKTEFSACSEVTSLLSYIETCKFDQCRVNSTPAGCPSIQSAADDCAMLGYYVDWRKATEGGCDFECPVGMEYKPAGPKPVASCSSGGSVEMTTELREGCFCPEGTMICDHACVPLPTSTIPPSTTQERTTTVTFTTEKPSTTEVTTAFISSATSIGSLPTTTETTPVSTTVDKSCRSVNPPRQFMESWKVDNCTIATCNGGDNISYSTKKCSVSKKPKCRNAMMVYDADGCCYTWKCFCNCKGWGDPHIRTFDQVLYAFLEDCTYTLVEEKVNRHHLSIITDNFQFFPGTPASFPRGITVNYNGNSVNMSIPAIVRKKQSIITVLYNNELVKLPFSSDGIEITSTDVIVTVHIPAIYSTIVFTGQMYSIDLPYELFGDNTQGQCGTCNNQASDDCVRKSGKSEASDCCQVTAKEWMVADPSKPHCKAPGPSGSVPCQTPTPTPTAPCVFDHKLCKAIDKTEFSACSEVTSLLSYIETCKFDQCRVNSTPAGCPSIQSAADDCAMLGYYVDWRKATEGGCDFECPVGMEYKPAGPKPVASCSSGGSVEMTTELREGCVCPEGTMICDHACVPLPTSTIPPSTTQERTTTVTFTTEKTSTTEVTTAFISSATSLESLPTTTETTPVSTTVDKGCRSVNPPRQFMESWKVDNCTIATCNGGDNISYSTKKCSVSKKPKCRNAMMVYDADGCCYTWKCFCNCKGWGDPHIRTFDQVLYVFLEDCTYTLVEEKVDRHHLSIITDNFQFYPGNPASFPRGITVNYNGNSVNMSIPAIVSKRQSIITVLYNNELVTLPFSSDGIEITSTDVIVTVQIPAIYSTIVFTGQMYSIDLPYELFGDNTQGQCGTCNNQGSDDCVRKSGKSEASDCCPVTAKEWMVADLSKPHCKSPGPSGSVPCETSTPTTTAPCVFDHKLCKAIDKTEFSACSEVTSLLSYIETCKFDQCRVNSTPAGCPSIQSAADDCAMLGYHVDWRKATEGGCDFECPVGMEYKPAGPKPVASCSSGGSVEMTTELREGCFCPEGTMICDHACVPLPTSTIPPSTTQESTTTVTFTTGKPSTTEVPTPAVTTTVHKPVTKVVLTTTTLSTAGSTPGQSTASQSLTTAPYVEQTTTTPQSGGTPVQTTISEPHQSTSSGETSTAPLSTTAFISSATSLGSLPTIPETTAVSTTVDKGCRSVNPPRQFMESWKVDNCTIATCNGGDNISYSTKKCSVSKKPKCRNAMMVYDADGCCYTWKCFCNCKGWGDPHIRTFDQVLYAFLEDCTYTLVEEKVNRHHLSIITDNFQFFPGTPASFPRGITVNYNGNSVNMSIPAIVRKKQSIITVLYNNELVKLPFSSDGIEITSTDVIVMVHIPAIYSTIVFTGQMFSIDLPYELFGDNTQGQCGTCNNQASDDCVRKSGKSEASDCCQVTAKEWMVADPSKPHCKAPGPSGSVPCQTPTPTPTAPCVFDHKLCKAIDKTEFSACTEVTSLLSYIETCKFDQCRVNSTPAGCPSIQSAADDCAMLGYYVDWRKATEGGCDFECPVGMEYKPAGPKPVASCSSGGSVEMTTELHEGCFCPEGTMICDHACVPLPTSTIPPSTTQERTTIFTFTTEKPSTTEGTTAFISSATSLGSLPTTPETTAVSTTVDKGCRSVNPPRQFMESWKVDNCTIATCNGGDNISYSTKQCSVSTKPKCRNAMMVYDADGCCYTWKCFCNCKGWGDPHIRTFDQVLYVFLEDCTYTLVEEKVDRHHLSIITDNFQFYPGNPASFPRGITVNYNGNSVNMSIPAIVSKRQSIITVLYNNELVTLPFSSDGIEITSTDVIVTVQIPAIYSTIVFTGQMYSIDLPYELFGDNTQGQCGTCNNQGSDDCVRKSGKSEASDCCPVTAKEWMVADLSKPHCKSPGPSGSVPCETSTPTTTAPCVFDHKLCKAIDKTEFSACSEVTSLLSYIETCKFDQCRVNSTPAGCPSIQSAADDCAMLGYHVDWRKATEGGCDFECPVGMEYKPAGPKPVASCSSGGSVEMTTELREGCFCPEGTMICDHACVPLPTSTIPPSTTQESTTTVTFTTGKPSTTEVPTPAVTTTVHKPVTKVVLTTTTLSTAGSTPGQSTASQSLTTAPYVEQTTTTPQSGGTPVQTTISEPHQSTSSGETSTAPLSTTAFISSATSLGSLPTIPETTAVSTTVDKGCRSVNPPRQFMESWKVDNCTIATCNGGDNISYSTKKCSVSKKPKCRNAMMVYDADGCCYTWKCFCNCKGWGDPHIRTFDQVLYAFLEDCTYTLVEEKVNRHHLSIITDNFQFFPGTPASFPRGITVNYNGNSVNMSIPAIVRKKQSIITVLYNNELVKLPFSSDGIEITSTDVIVMVHIPAIYSTIVFTGQMFSIDLPYELFGDNTQGQCGTCNNQASDDCVRKSGKSEASDCCQVTAKEWMVADPSKPHCKAPGPSGSVPCQTPTPTPTAPCVFDHKLCKAIDKTEFSACTEVTSLLSYIETCKFDQCRVNSTPAGCPSIQSAADDCAMLGYYVDWRKATEGGCDFECPVGMEYKPAGPKPVASCSSGGSVEMTTELHEGCFCPEGTMICDHACVPLPTSTIPPSTTQERTTIFTFTTEKPSTTEGTTAFISSATSLGSLPTTPETTAVSTTVDKGCRSVNPPRQFMESWKVDNCTIATCNGGDNISYSTKQCSVSTKPKCRNAMMVYDADGCCYTWKCFCNCKGWGDPHIRTFDQVLYVFLEDCTYTLVEEKVDRHHLSIITDNFQFYPGNPASFPRGITVNYNGNSVNMSIPAIVSKRQSIITVLYNNELVTLPFSSDGIEITSTDVIVTVQIPAIYSTIVFTGQMYSIDLPYELFGDNTQGQCGTCNNQGSDDCVRKSGKSEASDCCQVTAKEWMVADPSKPHCKSPGPSGSIPCQTPTPTTTAPCVFDHKLCKAIDKTEFSACSEVTSLLSYIETCKFDQCRVNSIPAGCPSIQSAADDCAMLGYYVDWRKATEGGCDFECPVGMEYKPAGPKPVASCSSGGSFEMTIELREGCFCPEGTMICDHACVPLPTSTTLPSTTQGSTTAVTFTTGKRSTSQKSITTVVQPTTTTQSTGGSTRGQSKSSTSAFTSPTISHRPLSTTPPMKSKASTTKATSTVVPTTRSHVEPTITPVTVQTVQATRSLSTSTFNKSSSDAPCVCKINGFTAKPANNTPCVDERGSLQLTAIRMFLQGPPL